MKRRSFLALLGAVGAAAAAPMQMAETEKARPGELGNMMDGPPWITLPSGILIQWGDSETGIVTFPRAFSQCFTASAMHEDGEEGQRLPFRRLSQTGAIINKSQESPVVWVAIGLPGSMCILDPRHQYGSRSLSI